MATLDDFIEWAKRDLSRFGRLSDHAILRRETGEQRLTIFTRVNKYQIRAKMESNWLGCEASSRTPRAGETWSRGRDLPDGPLTEETWRRILAAIVSFELVKVHV